MREFYYPQMQDATTTTSTEYSEAFLLLVVWRVGISYPSVDGWISRADQSFVNSESIDRPGTDDMMTHLTCLLLRTHCQHLESGLGAPVDAPASNERRRSSAVPPSPRAVSHGQRLFDLRFLHVLSPLARCPHPTPLPPLTERRGKKKEKGPKLPSLPRQRHKHSIHCHTPPVTHSVIALPLDIIRDIQSNVLALLSTTSPSTISFFFTPVPIRRTSSDAAHLTRSCVHQLDFSSSSQSIC